MCRATIRNWTWPSTCIRRWKASCSKTSMSAPATTPRSASCIVSSSGVNMAKPSALNTLADLAQNDTDAAARELGRLQGLRNQAEQQLAALTQYRQEYRERMQAIAQDGMTSTRWQDFAQFLASLDTAIRQQTESLAR